MTPAAAKTSVGLDRVPRLRYYIDGAPIAFVQIDREGRIHLANEYVAQMFGSSEEALRGRDWIELAFGGAAPDVRKNLAAIIDGTREPQEIEAVLRTPSGERRLRLNGRVVRDAGGTILGLSIYGVDVTALRESVRQLEDLKFALDASSIVATTDGNGKITYVNDKFCEISKFTRAELIGKSHRIINSGHHSSQFFREMWSTIESGRVWQADIKNKAKDGSFYWVATTIVPFVGTDGRPYQYLAIRNEITARKQAEEALERAVNELAEMSARERSRADALREAHDRLVEANKRILEEQSKVIQAEKLSSVGMLAAGVAHEINNPLAGVMACVKALKEGNLSPERREEYYGAVADGLERIRSTVRGLLDYARPQPTSIASVDLADAVRGCLLLLAAPLRKKQIEVDIQFPSGMFFARGNRSQLMQAAMNVLLNAMHASNEGSRIEVRGARKDGRVLLSFVDHGKGIPKEAIDRVCDPFFTTKPQGEGTGLGLAVTLGIVESHAGRLHIESEVGTGTTITFELPPAEAPAGDASGSGVAST